jgi:rhamnosyltransferase
MGARWEQSGGVFLEERAFMAETDGSGRTPSIAVIMRSKNEMPYAEVALERLMRQTRRDFTLYNVDSGSTDGTLEVVQRYNPDPERVTRIAPEDYVPGTVLNTMVERAPESIIVLLNADAIPMDDLWLEKLLRPILDDEADATMSRQLPRDCAPFIVKHDTARAYSAKNLAGKRSDFFSAVACAFRRSLWEQTKFYTDGYAEDLAWSKACQDKGARFKIVPESVVEHSHNFTIKGLYLKRYRHGLAYVYIYGDKPEFLRQAASWAKETVRDFLYAASKLRFDVTPYNLVYRATIHWAYYRGKCEGQRRYRRGR